MPSITPVSTSLIYTVLDSGGSIVNFVVWDGSSSWSVTTAYGAGFTVRKWQATDQLVTVFVSS